MHSLKGFHKHFKQFIDDLDIETLDIQQDQIEKFQHKALQESAWIQLLVTMKFWLEDTSSSFEKTDVFIELFERANIANKADADLFVSIHCNAHNSQASGTETFVLGEKNTGRNFDVAKRENEVIFLEDNYQENYAGFDPSSPESTIAIGIEQEVYVEQSIILARKIEDNFISKAKRKSRGLKQASLLVIRSTYMPSVLIEVGFLTNNKEGSYLNTKTGQLKMASSIKDAIIAYKKELDQNQLIPFHLLNLHQVFPQPIKTQFVVQPPN